MENEIQSKIERLEKAINSTVTPEATKDEMRKILDKLRSSVTEPVVVEEPIMVEEKPVVKYTDIKSCLLDDGDSDDDYIFEGKQIHNVETLPKDTWEITEFYNDGVILKHMPTSVLADHKPNKSVSFSELKTLFSIGKIEVDGIETGNTKVFNLCIKAILKCISTIDEIANRESVISELTAVQNDLEKNIEKANLLESEKADLLNKNSDLEKTSTDKILSLESHITDKASSFESAKAANELEAARLKKQLADLEALQTIRNVIDLLNEDVMRKDLKELRTSDTLEPKVEQIFPKEKIKVESITIHSSEGKADGYGFPKTFSSYEDANKALIPVYEDSIESGGYSNSANFTVNFEDGQKYEGTIFVSEKRSNPNKGNAIGEHIKSYLDFELSSTRQDEESKKEIKEFLDAYDLGLDEKYKQGDFVFADIFNDSSKKVPFVVAHYSYGKYYILGDGSHYVSEDKLSKATEKDFDEYYGEAAASFKKFEKGGSLGYGDIKKEKERMTSELFEKCGVFFAFSNEQFNENKTSLKEGEKYVSIGGGGYMPKGNYDTFKEGMKSINQIGKNKVKENNLSETEILYELNNHECFYTGDYSDVFDMFKGTYTEEQIRDVYNKHRESSQTFENGGKVESGDKVIITTSSLGKKYQGMQGTVNERKLINDKYSIKLENGLEMAFSKDEFRHNSVNPRWENGGGIGSFNDATEKAKKEINFLIDKGYSIDSYSTKNQDSVFGEGDSVIFATQGSKRPSKSTLEFAIAYFYENEESGVMQIEEGLLDLIADGFSNFKITLYTNAGVDLHSKYKGKYKNIEVVKVPFDTFSKYEKGGDISNELSSLERERLDVLQNREDLDSLTKDENKEYESLVKNYRKTNAYKKKQIEKSKTWGLTFPEAGREGMYKGSDVIVTANRAGDVLFDELDKDGKVVNSGKESLSEFRSYFSPFEPRETDVIFGK